LAAVNAAVAQCGRALVESRPATTADVPFLGDVVVAATRDQGRLPDDFDEPGWRAGFAAWSAEQIKAGPGTFVIECDGGPVGRLRVVDSADCPRNG
jgi:hypothetical protein